jgi:hypothetical protein
MDRWQGEPVRAVGSGKSHFLDALGHLAIDKGMRVAWLSLERSGALVRRPRADDSVTKAPVQS